MLLCQIRALVLKHIRRPLKCNHIIFFSDKIVCSCYGEEFIMITTLKYQVQKYKDKVTQILRLMIIVRKHLRENFLAYVYNDSCLFTSSSLTLPTLIFPFITQ